MGVVIQAIRDSAKGEQCTLHTPWCNNDPETTVFCHGPNCGLKGMSNKVDDWFGSYGCNECHRAMDERRDAFGPSIWFQTWLRAIARTQRRLYEKGIMQFPEWPTPPRVVSKIVKHPGRMRR